MVSAYIVVLRWRPELVWKVLYVLRKPMQHKLQFIKLILFEYIYIYIYMRNDMFTTFLQQILSGRLLLVVIVGLKK